MAKKKKPVQVVVTGHRSFADSRLRTAAARVLLFWVLVLALVASDFAAHLAEVLFGFNSIPIGLSLDSVAMSIAVFRIIRVMRGRKFWSART